MHMYMNNPKISIIVPVYNVEKYLRRCLDSIVAQTFTDWECICVDDGSPDNSGKILDEYAVKDKRFVIIHKENGGVSSARNAGLDIARGEYVTFCDSDDWVEADWLLVQYTDIVSEDFDVCICGFYGKGKQKRKVLNQIAAKTSIFAQNGIGGYSFLRLIRRKNIDIVRYDTSIAYLEDSEFFYRLFDNCDKILWTNKPLYHYENNPESVTRVCSISRAAVTGVTILEKLFVNEKEKKIRNNLNFQRKSLRLYLCTLYLIGSNDCYDVIYNEYKESLRKTFFSFFIDFRLKIKQKIVLFLICFYKYPRNTLVFKYIQNKRIGMERNVDKA